MAESAQRRPRLEDNLTVTMEFKMQMVVPRGITSIIQNIGLRRATFAMRLNGIKCLPFSAGNLSARFDGLCPRGVAL